MLHDGSLVDLGKGGIMESSGDELRKGNGRGTAAQQASADDCTDAGAVASGCSSSAGVAEPGGCGWSSTLGASSVKTGTMKPRRLGRGDRERPQRRLEVGDRDTFGERPPGNSNICSTKLSACKRASLLEARVSADGVGGAPMELQVLSLLGMGGVCGGESPARLPLMRPLISDLPEPSLPLLILLIGDLNFALPHLLPMPPEWAGARLGCVACWTRRDESSSIAILQRSRSSSAPRRRE